MERRVLGWGWVQVLRLRLPDMGLSLTLRVRLKEANTCPRWVSGKFCLSAGDFLRRPLEDPFNPLTDSVITVASSRLLRRQEL